MTALERCTERGSEGGGRAGGGRARVGGGPFPTPAEMRPALFVLHLPSRRGKFNMHYAVSTCSGEHTSVRMVFLLAAACFRLLSGMGEVEGGGGE